MKYEIIIPLSVFTGVGRVRFQEHLCDSREITEISCIRDACLCASIK